MHNCSSFVDSDWERKSKDSADCLGKKTASFAQRRVQLLQQHLHIEHMQLHGLSFWIRSIALVILDPPGQHVPLEALQVLLLLLLQEQGVVQEEMESVRD